MSASDKDERDRGVLFLEKLLLQDEWQTFNALSDEEIESIRRSLPHGDRPVPSAEEMMAGALRKLAERSGDGATVTEPTDAAKDAAGGPVGDPNGADEPPSTP
jgi:hypothetical protein